MSPALPFLPFELLLAQLSTLELLQSIYSEELQLDPATASLVPNLQAFLAAEDAQRAWQFKEKELKGTFHLLLHRDDSDQSTFPLDLSFTLPLIGPYHTKSASLPLLSLHQPSWLSRGDHAILSQLVKDVLQAHSDQADGADLILLVLEELQEKARTLLPKCEANTEPGILEVQDELFRFWLWFPSLSTREKRDDIVNWASDYGLTGFVMAGKPALLCLEGTVKNVENYMGEIKSKSWADIPSFQKKVTERYRSRIDCRKFEKMTEITNLIGQGGARGNRGEMGELREYLVERGLGNDFGQAIGGGTFQ